MSKKVKVKLNRAGVAELLHSDAMGRVLVSAGRQVAENAGEGFELVQKPTRVIAVETATKAAVKDNLERNTLLKAVRK